MYTEVPKSSEQDTLSSELTSDSLVNQATYTSAGKYVGHTWLLNYTTVKLNLSITDKLMQRDLPTIFEGCHLLGGFHNKSFISVYNAI